MSRPWLLVIASGASVLLISGCTSTQDKAAAIRRNAGAFNQKGVTVARRNPDVAVSRTSVIQDQNGTAAVVEMRNKSGRDLSGLPIAIDVLGKKRERIFRNDTPGLEPSLTGTSVLARHASLFWVNDQVAVGQDVGARARSVKAKVGEPTGPRPPRTLPKISLSTPRITNDPYSGSFARGNATNASKVEQRKLIIFAVARKGGRIVAAGRGGIDRLPAKGRRLYRIFFIGNPKGAQIELSAPPTVLQ